MEFLTPYALAGFALAAPVVLFYILRVRLRRREVPTLMFWQEAFQERRLTAWWRRLRHLLSLVVQLLLLSLLVLAAARPLMPWEERQRRDWSIVIDNSASMSATMPGGETRLHHAQQRALRWLRRLPDDDRIAILATAPRPHVVCSFTTHRGTLRAALQRIRPTHAPAALERAVALARGLATDTKRHRILLLSDGCASDAAQVQASSDLWIDPIGTPNENLAITRFAPRRSYLDPAQLQLLIEVGNFGRHPVRTRLQVDLDGEPLDVIPLELAPGGRWHAVQEYLAEEGGVLTARVANGGALAADDTAWAIVEPLREVDVMLVTPGNLFLEKVFEAMSGIRLRIVTDQTPEPGAVVVYHRRVPQELPPNPTIVIDPQTGSSLWELGETVREPVVESVQDEHPLMAHVRLDQVLLPEARSLRFHRPATTLAATLAGEPLYALIERPGGDVLVLTANLDKGDLPLRTAFPIMMANAIAWLTHASSDHPPATPTGRLAAVHLEQSPGRVVALSPSGRRLPVATTDDGRQQFGPVDEVGLWRLEAATAADGATNLAVVAVTLSEPAESDLRKTWTTAQFKSHVGPRRVGSRATWWYLALGALALAAIEWYLYQRRWIA